MSASKPGVSGAKLVQYYADEGRLDTLTIDMPKGGYAPVFKKREAPIPAKRSVGALLLSRNTVVVLPFEDLSPSGELGYFCKGLREEILHRLTALRGLRILAVSGPAALVIGGGVRLVGARVRITVNMIDGASDCYLWSEAIDADLADDFVVQQRVAETIVSKLAPEMKDDSHARKALDRPAENLAAKNLYLQGRYHLNQRSEEGLRKAVDFFVRAMAEDPDYALAHSGLADAYGLLGHYGVARSGGSVDEGGVPWRVSRDARRLVGRGPHVARACEGDARLGLGWS